MTREMMPLREAIGRLAHMHEAERDRIEAWVEEVAPKIAAEFGISLKQCQQLLDAYSASHLATLGEILHQDALDWAATIGPDPLEAGNQP